MGGRPPLECVQCSGLSVAGCDVGERGRFGRQGAPQEGRQRVTCVRCFQSQRASSAGCAVCMRCRLCCEAEASGRQRGSRSRSLASSTLVVLFRSSAVEITCAFGVAAGNGGGSRVEGTGDVLTHEVYAVIKCFVLHMYGCGVGGVIPSFFPLFVVVLRVQGSLRCSLFFLTAGGGCLSW